jgi:hypothetical protein
MAANGVTYALSNEHKEVSSLDCPAMQLFAVCSLSGDADD